MIRKLPILRRNLVCGLLSIAGLSACLPGGARDCSQPSAPVEIVRDEWGVPHVFARTLADAAWGQGYAQAADRLLQIDLLRRTARGSRAELLGESELEMDRLVRTLGLVQAAEASLAALAPETICWVDAFAGGINRYLEDLRLGRNGAHRSADLDALDPTYIPPDWNRIDVVIVATAATFSLSSNLIPDLVLTATRLLEGDEAFTRFVRFEPLADVWTTRDPALDGGIVPLTDTTITAGRSASTSPVRYSKPDIARALSRTVRILTRLRDNLGPYSSNNWVIAPQNNGTAAIMASDPHGAIAVPSSFHEIHLLVESPPINAYGIAVAGGPMVHIGHNTRTAWAFTNYGADVADLYTESVDPDDTDAVLRNGDSIPIETRTETILVRPAGGRVADAVAETIDVRSVPGHGPILNDVLPDPLPILFAGAPLTYRWIGAGDTREAQALARLLTITDWADFLANAEDWQVGAQNTVYADTDGNIGYHATGLFPGRPWVSPVLNPIEPLPGDGSAEWQGFAPFDAIRTLFNPAWGFLASANGDPAGFLDDGDPLTPEYLGYVFDMGFRTQRIKSTLAAGIAAGTADAAYSRRLQTDITVGFAELLRPRLMLAAARQELAQDPSLAPLLVAVSDWDLRATTDATGAAIFHQWVVRLLNDFIAAPLFAPLRPLLPGDPQFGLRALAQAIKTEDPFFFPTGFDVAAASALRQTRMDLDAFFATTDVSRWTWGQMHMRELRHPVDAAFDLGPLPAPGGFATVNRADFLYLDEDHPATPPYTIADGPDMRLIVELDSDAETWIIMPHGSSGDPDSPHYADQFAMWVAGEYRRAHISAEDVRAAQVSSLILK